MVMEVSQGRQLTQVNRQWTQVKLKEPEL